VAVLNFSNRSMMPVGHHSEYLTATLQCQGMSEYPVYGPGQKQLIDKQTY